MSNFGKKYDPNKRLRNKILNETKNSLRPRKQRKTNTTKPIKKYKKQKPNIFSYIVLLFLVLFFIFKK